MPMNFYRNFIVSSILLILIISSCDNITTKGPKINDNDLQVIDVDIHRYGKALFDLDTNNFSEEVSKIQDEFSLFLGQDIDDPNKLAPLYEYVTDTQLITIGKEVNIAYPDLVFLESQLSDAISRYNYFFDISKKPTIYTYISDLYYERPVIIDDSVIIIALDVYLGPGFTKYRSLGLPYYKIRRMTSENISIDVMKEFYNVSLNPHFKEKTLLDRMISSGKIMYYLDAVLPNVPDSLKIGYTSNQINWIDKNSSNVWAFLVKNQLFYSPDYKAQSNLLEDAPFTSGFSNESPPRLGTWLGWQIIREYMSKHQDISLKTLINMHDSQEIFNSSGYKP